MKLRYRHTCPNCGGLAEAERLEKGLPCTRCLPVEPGDVDVESVARALASEGKLAGYAWLYTLEKEFAEFAEYFRDKTGSSLWSAQRSWARRLLMLESLAIIAPTGVGKTTLLTVYAAYRAEMGWRVLYLVPTENLVRQAASRLEALVPGRVAWYASSLGKRAREEALARFEAVDYSVAVVTTGFLQRRLELLAKAAPFDLIIVDDVDSLLRSSKNVERVLHLLGYPEEAVKAAESLVKTRLSLYAALAQGREAKAEEYRVRIAELEAELRAFGGPRGQLVIASATGRPRGIKHLIFKELLGFEVGGGSDYLRNVLDSYTITDNPLAEVVKVVKKLGPGGIVFVSQAYGKHFAKALAERLEREGVPVAKALAGSRRAVAKLESGEVWVLVGVASRYGVVVRGIDLPERVKYTVFLGAPGRIMKAEDALVSPRRLLRVLLYLADEGSDWAAEAARRLRKLLDRIPDPSLVVAAVKGRINADGVLADAAEAVREYAARAMEEIASRLSGREALLVGAMVFEKSGESLLVFVPDAPTYIQASGRSSRLYKGVMTFGISVVVERLEERVRALESRLAWMSRSRFQRWEEVDLGTAMREVEETRKGKGRKVDVKTVLLVVESPTKARTIAWFWGRPAKRRVGRLVAYETSTLDEESGTVYLLTVVATRGHIFDLAVDEEESRYGVRIEGGEHAPIYTTVKRCLSCGYQFTEESRVCPRCGSSAVLSSSSVVETLRKLAVEVDQVIVATDPDREGEKIAWDVYLAVKPYNRNVMRGWFHEVTPRAVMEALKNPSSFKKRLVEAQVVRRVVDRWIGFSISEHLWWRFGKRWLGAGRVQTPVLGWIIDRYEEWKATRGYRVIALLDGGWRISVYSATREEAEAAASASIVRAREYSEWTEDSNPPPPFTTDSLIYEASRVLGYPARLVMKLAQDLFESGLITYHRTDSTRVSTTGMIVAKEYLERKGLAGLYKPRQWGDGGAHEAIRPTRPLDAEEVEKAVLEGSIRVPVKLTRAHLRLYDLIFRRFIASQMAPAKLTRAHSIIELGPLKEEVVATVDVVEPGYAAVYPPRLAPWLRKAASEGVAVKEARIVRSSKVPLFRSGEVVRLMKEKRIGRPSTYAKAIEANRRHGYVIESKRRGYLVPTKLGIEVYTYLSEKFGEVLSEETSRKLEESLDLVEDGGAPADEVLSRSWELVRGLVEAAEAAAMAEVEA